MNDELLLSLYLDGRLEPAAAAALQRRLESEPELAAQFEAMQRLQSLSADLAPAQADFTAADLRQRRTRRAWIRTAAAIAAVLLLALTHGSAYLLGAKRTDVDTTARTPLDETEEVLANLARIDPGTPPAKLQRQLVGLREQIRPLPHLLTEWTPHSAPLRRRAAEYADALVQLELAFEQVSDPGFRAVAVASIARGSLEGNLPLRFMPATTNRYARADPLGGGRFRFIVVRRIKGIPRLLVDEGTVAELQGRHEEVQFINEKGN